ncbi:universal stress protein [Hymenobacter sp. BT186]|uniref:Universal stress protein n=1 Tax=Hymenobacter telluris TaxID=2816474 RepID=A0A939JE10_9BACT|nr:universal stress protein [Hymenobacter telluris]MBO0359965.1 universal stress protein [Hymenobacter telluris]MBW3375992.1 universal stress protein [Hymenobacter norwichensis]
MAACFLVLTDFTPAADQALTYADKLATQLGASLVLLHIRRESLLDPDAFNGYIQRMSEGEVAAALAERTAPLTSPTTVETSVAGITEATQQAMGKYQPLLLVLGKPDSSKIPDELVTTTSLNLLRAVSLPLLVVSMGQQAAVPAHVVVAADGEVFQLSAPVAEGAQQLLAALSPDVTVAYVAEPEHSDDTKPAVASVQESGLIPEASLLQGYGVRNRRASEGILQALTDKQADLLLVIARRRSFFGHMFNHSVSSQLVLHSPVPVLLLPAVT